MRKFRVGDTVKWKFRVPEYLSFRPESEYPIETVRITRIEPDVHDGDRIWGYFNNDKVESYVHADDDGWIFISCPMEAMP